MESQAASSMKLAILLIIMGNLIFGLMVLVNIVKPNIFQQVLSVVNVTDEEKERQFDDYDQKKVSGSKVLRAMKQFENTAFGIVYQTVATKASGDYAQNFGGIFKEATAVPTLPNGGYIYTDSKIHGFTSWRTAKNSHDLFYTAEFLMVGGNVARCDNKVVARGSDMSPEYIPPDARFKAVLIKDITGETIGICFTQE